MFCRLAMQLSVRHFLDYRDLIPGSTFLRVYKNQPSKGMILI
jgi:hypothetical protein